MLPRPLWASSGRAPDEVVLDRRDRHRSHRHQPLLAALAGQPHHPRVEVEVVGGQADRLGDAGAGPVQDLEQCLVPELDRRRVDLRACGRQQPLDLVDGDRLGQPLGRGGRAHVSGGVEGGQPLPYGEPVQAAGGDHRPGRRRGRERRVVAVTGAQVGQERGDVGLGDAGKLGDPPPGEAERIAA